MNIVFRVHSNGANKYQIDGGMLVAFRKEGMNQYMNVVNIKAGLQFPSEISNKLISKFQYLLETFICSLRDAQ